MRALLSVYDKSGIVELATELHELEVELVSSGGTAQVIADAGIPVTDVADFTGFAPMLGHRVVTLHPRVHGGILADRRDTTHLRDLEEHNIDLIDIVVGNLYPFGEKPSIDLIDIGGPTLLRAAAKNHEYVTVLVDAADYPTALEEIRQAGTTSLALRSQLARKAFAHTAAYDAEIATWFNANEGRVDNTLPSSFHLSLEKTQDLRYGENPHQVGARYQVPGKQSWWDTAVQHSGLEPSYLNIFDTDAAWRLVHSLAEGSSGMGGAGANAACVIVKHANPCGASVAEDLATAYSNAFACDTQSAFGGIVACNQIVDAATAEAMVAAAQADVIIAPGFADGVVKTLIAKRANTRILSAVPPIEAGLALRQLSDSYLVQERHRFDAAPATWSVVTERKPTASELVDAEIAWRLCSHVSSNAIVLVKDRTAFGIGAGQQNRVNAGQIAATKADGRVVGGACASDAFYPFADGVEAAAEAGVAVVVQPGGSVNDEVVIETANRLGLAMIFTGERQFRH